MDTTTLAWIGAITGIIGTLTGGFALLWNIYTWKRNRGDLHFDAVIAVTQDYGNFEHIVLLTVESRLDRDTTITSFDVFGYQTLWRRMMRQEDDLKFSILFTRGNRPIPAVLHPGHVWTGDFPADENLQSAIRTGYFYCQVRHSQSDKPMTVGIR